MLRVLDCRVLGELVRAIDGEALGYWASTNEVCLKAGIPAEAFSHAIVDDERTRVELIAALRRAGFVSWGAKQLEEAVLVAHHWKDFGGPAARDGLAALKLLVKARPPNSSQQNPVCLDRPPSRHRVKHPATARASSQPATVREPAQFGIFAQLPFPHVRGAQQSAEVVQTPHLPLTHAWPAQSTQVVQFCPVEHGAQPLAPCALATQHCPAQSASMVQPPAAGHGPHHL